MSCTTVVAWLLAITLDVVRLLAATFIDALYLLLSFVAFGTAGNWPLSLEHSRAVSLVGSLLVLSVTGAGRNVRQKLKRARPTQNATGRNDHQGHRRTCRSSRLSPIGEFLPRN